MCFFFNQYSINSGIFATFRYTNDLSLPFREIYIHVYICIFSDVSRFLISIFLDFN